MLILVKQIIVFEMAVAIAARFHNNYSSL